MYHSKGQPIRRGFTFQCEVPWSTGVIGNESCSNYDYNHQAYLPNSTNEETKKLSLRKRSKLRDTAASSSSSSRSSSCCSSEPAAPKVRSEKKKSSKKRDVVKTNNKKPNLGLMIEKDLEKRDIKLIIRKKTFSLKKKKRTKQESK
jgi:hypothetical protein